MTKRRFNIVISVILLIVCLSMCAIASYAWYHAKPSADYSLDINADGFLYVYLEVPIDVLGENDRYLVPAVAMPKAVSNGMYMDVLTVYDENSENPSYIQKIASQVEYESDFTLQQADNQTSYIQYYISVKDGTSESANTYSKSEFTFSEVGFKYYYNQSIIENEGTENETITINTIEVNPLTVEGGSQSADKKNGIIVITGGQKIFLNLTMNLSNVDELIDESLALKNSVFVEIAFTVLL